MRFLAHGVDVTHSAYGTHRVTTDNHRVTADNHRVTADAHRVTADTHCVTADTRGVTRTLEGTLTRETRTVSANALNPKP